MKKKIFASILAVAMTLSLAACGAKQEAPAATPSAPAASAPAAAPSTGATEYLSLGTGGVTGKGTGNGGDAEVTVGGGVLTAMTQKSRSAAAC